ncbi:hypothetical protein ACU8NH_24275 [Rhizobium leguminosarum]
MGYVLNELTNLPIDDKVDFYIFVINGQYREPIYDIIQNNFFEIARSIGSHAVIATGTDPRNFTTSVARKYLGKDNSDSSFRSALPALLITNGHPEQLSSESMRLVIPLRDAEKRFGGWHQFFDLLARFVRGESDEFVRRFENQENFLDTANKVVGLKPGIFGISVNINELIDLWNKRRKRLA